MIRDIKKTGGTYSTILDAYNAADAGDILEIQDNEEYVEQVTIAKENLTLAAAAGFSPSIRSFVAPIIVDSAVSNFLIHGSASGYLRIKSTSGAKDTIRVSGATNLTAHHLEFFDTSNQRCISGTASTGAIYLVDCVFVGHPLYGTIADVKMSGCSGNVLSVAYYINLGGYIRQCQFTCSQYIFERTGGLSVFSDLEVSANYFLCTSAVNISMIACGSTALSFESNTVVASTAGTLADFADFFSLPVATVFKNNIITGFDIGISGAASGAWGDYNCLNCTTNYAGSVIAGAHDIAADPEVDGFRIPSGSACEDAGTSDVLFSTDILGTTRPQDAAFDIGCYEVVTLRLLSVDLDGRTLTATMNVTPDGGSFGAPSAWMISVYDGLADWVLAETVVTDGPVATITLDAIPTPGGLYRVLAPLDLESAAGDIITEENARAYFSVPITEEAPAPMGVLETLTSAVGRGLARLIGSPTTRLTADFLHSDTVAHVESTLHFDAEGFFQIGDQRLAYSGKTGTTLTGITRIENTFEDFTKGAEIRDANRHWSLRDVAWSECGLSTCPDAFVDVLAADSGFPRPLQAMSTEDVRRYAMTLNYLDRGTWLSIFRVLRWMFHWCSQSGSDATAYADSLGDPVRWLDIPDTSLAVHDLANRWIFLNGVLSRIITAYDDKVAGMTTLLIETTDGPFWNAPNLTDGQEGIEWELLAYTMEEAKWTADAKKIGYVRISIFVQDPTMPATYLLSSGLALPQGRLERGTLSPDHTPDGAGKHRLYLVQPYKTATEGVLKEVVAAGVKVEVVSRSVPS